MYNVSIKTDWTLRLLLSVLCLKVQLSYFWHNTQRYFYHIFWWNNEDILKLKVSRGCVGYFKTYLFFFFYIKKAKTEHEGEILKWYLGHKNKPLCFVNYDSCPFNNNVMLLVCQYLIKKCNSNDLHSKQKVKNWNPKAIRFISTVSQLSIMLVPWFLFYLVKMARR